MRDADDEVRDDDVLLKLGHSEAYLESTRPTFTPDDVCRQPELR